MRKNPKNTKNGPQFFPLKKTKNPTKKFKNAPTVFPPKKYKNALKHKFWFWCFDFVFFSGIFVFVGGDFNKILLKLSSFKKYSNNFYLVCVGMIFIFVMIVYSNLMFSVL